VLYTVHFTAFCLGGRFFSGHGVGYTTDGTPLLVPPLVIGTN